MLNKSVFPLAALLASGVCLADDATDESEDPKWDINGAHGGDVVDVSFTTDEGTWMNVDVSPDGASLVFDLLGDIYTVDINGGKATRLVGDRSMDVQPTYSPDGSMIAFTSDRGGGDNLWVMNADGSDLRQVTEEDFRLLNNPVWTPDGQYLIARKHFTSERSLGAGEMWMYHVSGGAGVQLTERKNDQQDAGEPAISPDGQYVYFSEDMSGGSTFQYNKDANGSIYEVRQLDLETGELISLIRGNGGSATPTPSPDGSKIAFVRRDRDKTVLFVHDTVSGAQTALYDGLNHDQQEAWAIFGIYPGMAWTPDAESLVFWADGKIKRIHISSREVREIPFSVDVEQTVVSAVRGQYEVGSDNFVSHMLRDAVTSPDGRTLVFHSVGYLWQVSLPDGAPERLTDGSDFEYQPHFSPDGRSVVYTTWNDDSLASIRSIGLNGRGARQLNQRPGYYFSPRYSPDGERIVYQRGGGTSLLGYLHSSDQGLFVMDAAGGPGQLVTRSGYEPRFSADGEHLYYMSGGGLEKTYRRVDVDGRNDREIFKLKYVNHIEPSPDGKWVAFSELYNAYLAPMPSAGSSIELNKDTKAIPIRQVSADVGSYIHWSNASTRLNWLVGNDYHSAELQDVFEFVDGAPDDMPDLAEAVGSTIELTVDADVPAGAVALTNATVITMNGDEVLEDATVLIEGQRITGVGSDIAIPEGAEVIDVSGKTVVPGFVDVHAHVNHFQSGPSTAANWAYYANLAYGVTTSHDPSATTEFVFSQAELVRAGAMVGPRIFSTGTILYGADGDFKAVVNSLDDARSHLRRMQENGAFSVKSYNQPRRDQRQQINQAARELGMIVVMEGGSTFYHNLSMIYDGSTGIEHNLPIAPLYDDVLSLWAATDVGYTPTLVVSYGGLSGEYYWYEHTDVADLKPLSNFVPQWNLDARARRRQKTPEEEYNHIDVSAAAKTALDRGIDVMVGGHGQMQGLAVHWEMWSLAQGGMTEHEVLRAGTLAGAKYIGLDDDLGSIEPGKLADLVVLNANPLDHIHNTQNTAMVMANGRLYDTHTMNELAPHAKDRPAFWFEREGAQRAPASGPGASHARPFTCACGRH